MKDPAVDRAEALLWEAVRELYGPGGQSKVAAAALAVEALSAYRAAVAARAISASRETTSVAEASVAA
jgi:hypothetical protein